MAVAILGSLLVVVPGSAPAADEPEAQNVTVATGSGPLETSITVEILETEETAAGVEIRRWVPAERLSVGDEIHYTVRVRNPGKEPVTGVVVTKRLPFGVQFQRGSATGPASEVQYSTDGGATFKADKDSARAGGSKKPQRKTPVVEYSHVRWVLTRPLGPNSTALLRFRAIFS